MYNISQSHPLFSQTINKFKYHEDINFYLEEIQKIKKTQPNQSKSPFYKDLIYSSNFYLFQQFPQFNHLQQFLENLIYHNYNFKPDIFNSWFNINPKHTFVSIHHHGDSVLSGIFYLQIPPNDQGLVIHNKFNITEAVSLKLYPKDIIIMDGNQLHSTFPNTDNQEKIAIAFNIKKLE